jgi:hypothetical protein
MKRILLALLLFPFASAQVCELTPELWQLTVDAADAQELDPHLLLAVFWTESRWCHVSPETGELTKSSAGALGIGQLMPGTAELLEVDIADQTANAYGAAEYLKMQWEEFQDWTLALAAYNAGPEAVAEYDGVPPFEETQAYVRRVLEQYDEFKTLESLALPEDHASATLAASELPNMTSSPQEQDAPSVIYALLPTGDQRTPFQGVYLLPQTMNGQTVYVLLEPQSFDQALEVQNVEPAEPGADGEEFDAGYITFGRAKPEPDNRE